MGFGKNLKKARTEQGITQTRLAQEVYVSNQMINSIEAEVRTPSLYLALAIARRLDTTVEELAKEGEA